MKPFVEIDEPLDNVKAISNEIYLYIKNHTNMLAAQKRGWQFINSTELLNAAPNLNKFFRNNKLYVNNSAVTLVYDNSDLPVHIDEPPVVAKINFPVYNTENWKNSWYQITPEQIKKCQLTTNQFGKEIPDLSSIEDLKILDQIDNFIKPIVFNSSIPHSVEKLNDNAPVPRIVASFTFHNEPLSWLK